MSKNKTVKDGVRFELTTGFPLVLQTSAIDHSSQPSIVGRQDSIPAIPSSMPGVIQFNYSPCRESGTRTRIPVAPDHVGFQLPTLLVLGVCPFRSRNYRQ